MDRILKLVYSHKYIRFERPQYLYNGIHPALSAYLLEKSKEIGDRFNLDQEISKVVSYNTKSNWHFTCHSNFYHYTEKFFSTSFGESSNIIHADAIKNDGSIYLYPIEIRTTINEFVESFTMQLENNTYQFNFLDTIPTNVLQFLKTGLVKLIVNIIQDPCTDSKMMQLIEQMFNKTGIDGSNIIFIWGNNYQKYYSDFPKSKIKLTYGFLPLQQQAQNLSNFPRISSLGYLSDIVRESDLELSKHNYRKRFLCFNRTMKQHRYMLAYLALKHNFLKDNIFSFLNLNGDETHIANSINEFVSDIDESTKYATTIKKMIPYEIDTHHLNADEMRGFGSDNNNKEFYLNTYVHLTSETCFSEGDLKNPFFSEKTFRPIQNLQPFLFFGNPYSLQLLRELGFVTFTGFIDESYDQVEDSVKRMKLLEHEVLKIKNKTPKDMHKWYYSMKDILIWNQNHLLSFVDINPFSQVFSDINKFYANH